MWAVCAVPGIEHHWEQETKENKMRLPFLLCVTSLAATTALAQQEPSSPSSKATQPSSQSTLSPTGRTSGQQQHFRSTRIIGAPVKTSAAEDVGRIEDVVLNPTSGRIDFAVISAENKLCPVPWQLLSVSSEAGTPGSTSTTTPSPTTPSTSPSAGAGAYASAMGQQPTFTLNVEKSKLQQGPSFERSRWPEMSASWSQKIYTHYGVQADAGVGGTGSGSFKSSTDTQSDQGSTGKSSSDSKK
jgi:sporulation protein YlmC with PRC-barrel domain